MEWISFIIWCGYVIFSIRLFHNYSEEKPEFVTEEKISIIVAFRNEEKNLGFLIDDLLSQNYNSNNFEILLVDDHSTDTSFHIASEKSKKHSQINLLSLPDGAKGKNAAINLASEYAKYDIIAFTDADCRVPKDWLQAINSKFSRKENQLVIGGVNSIRKNGIWNDLVQLEFASLQISTISLAKIRRAIMSNGANLAIRKSVLNNFFSQYQITRTSGLDMFLLLFVKENYPEGIGVFNHAGLNVKTELPHNLKKFYQQRIRWASKNRELGKDADIRLVGALVLAMNLLWIALLFSNWAMGLVSFIVKSLLDWLSIHKKKQEVNLWYIPLVNLLYPIYMFSVGLGASLFAYKWKGREIKKGH